MHISGCCHCGLITYEAEVDPSTVVICHCTDCQTLSGSAFRVSALAADFRVLSGQPKVYAKTAESGHSLGLAFCGECGTHLYSTSPTDSQFRSIRVGTTRQRAQLLPRRQIWCRSALDWTMDVGAIQPMAQQQQ